MTNLRKNIFNLISSIQAFDDLEEAQKSQTLAWLKSSEQIFRIKKPNIPNKHLICYLVLFDPINFEILLIMHKKSGLMLPPGGHVEIDEHPNETVIRECIEELGINLSISNKPMFISETISKDDTLSHTDVCLWYTAYCNNRKIFNFCKTEIEYIKWYPINSIPYTYSDKNLNRFIKKLVRLQ